jgi:hypothetical protein
MSRSRELTASIRAGTRDGRHVIWDGRRQAGPTSTPGRWTSLSSTGGRRITSLSPAACAPRRRDGKGHTLTDPLPEGLRLRIVADYHADPVARDPAVTSQQHGVSGADEDRALDALRLAWGDAYDIGCEYGRWIATSRDAEGRTLAGDTPGDLNAEIRTDWAHEGTL